ncbi:hypothetical protein ONZ45_g18226 [Pleurotus djamor]|nr:hypothetical protein ONZ45_g18226 [Pleurotus djamor]
MVAIGTDTLSVGVNVPHCQDVVVLLENDHDADMDDIIQKVGRAGRNRGLVTDPRGIIYVTHATKLAADKLASTFPPNELPSFVRFLTAACKMLIIDELYDNPAFDPPCSCSSCASLPSPTATSCHCSGCITDSDPPESMALTINATKNILPPAAVIPRKDRLHKEMRQYATEQLCHLRTALWKNSNPLTEWMLHEEVFLPDALITQILDHYALLVDAGGDTGGISSLLRDLLSRFPYAQPHLEQILSCLQSCQPKFSELRAAKKLRQAEKARLRRQGHTDPNPRTPTAYHIFLKVQMQAWKEAHPLRAKEAYAQALALWRTSPENPKNKGTYTQTSNLDEDSDSSSSDEEVYYTSSSPSLSSLT